MFLHYGLDVWKMKGTFRCQIARKKYIVAFDQGTTSSRAIVLDHDANVVSIAQREFTQIYPQPKG